MTSKSNNNGTGCFRSVVSVFEIMGAVAGVIGVVIAILIAIYGIRHPDKVEVVLNVLADVTPSPPATSPAATNTAIPTPTDTVIPTPSDTATPTPTPTVTPTPTNTSTPTPTGTPTPTNTPSSTPTPSRTPSPTPTMMAVGDEWSDDRVTLKMDRRRFAPHWTIGVVNWYFAIDFRFWFENHSGDQIVLRFDAKDFSLKDNSGRDYDCVTKNGSFHFTGDPVSVPVSNAGEFTFHLGCARNKQFDEKVDYLILSVHDFSSLGSSSWRIEVPR